MTPTPDVTIADSDEPWMDAARTALWAYDVFSNAKTPIQWASALDRLHNAMHDLVTWLPEYDLDRGWLVGEGDDA